MKWLRLVWEGFMVALRSLRGHRLRTLLTMLGVAIGIFAITIIFTLVNSLNYSITRNLSKLGNTVIYVHHFPWTAEGFDWRKYARRPRVSYDDFRRLKKNLDEADAVSYEVRVAGELLKYKGKAAKNVRVRAITEDFVAINALEFGSGRPFTASEVGAGRPVAIIGQNVQKALFSGRSALDKMLRLRGKKLMVVGVLDKMGAASFGDTFDDMIIIPYPLARRLYNLSENSRSIDKMVTVRAASPELLDNVEAQTVGLMRASRGLRPKTENNFAINRPEMLINLFGTALGYLSMGGIFISIFSVIVGGFGIGNIMYTTVKERTFEIGLQKSLGATRSFILFQFLMEAILLCLIGGTIGLMLNFGVATVIQTVLNQLEIEFTIVVSAGSLIVGILLSVFIGLISGLVPSLIAARMDPVEAMRG